MLFDVIPGSWWWLPPLALVLDLAFGDPAFLPHPVCGLGRLLGFLEAPARRLGRDLLGGVLAVLCLCAVSVGISLAVLSLPYGLGFVAGLYLAWTGLALGSLLREGRKALNLVETAGLDEARRAVGMLVSRQTATMERADLRRSLAESLSENFNDGFVAPFFWLVLLGPAGLWLCKAVSTVDSMWGYKTPKWLLLGRFGARFDDVLAFVPARLCVFFLGLAGRLLFPGVPKPTLATIRRQAAFMESPNSGLPMAAAAWMIGGTMGGPTPYEDGIKDKPRLGPPDIPWTGARISALIDLLRTAGLLAAGALWAMAFALSWLF